MGKKGKGRQSGGFGSKSHRAAHNFEWRDQADQEVGFNLASRQKTAASSNTAASQSRPRLTRLGQLKGILRERHFQESHELLERRRRLGFVPDRTRNETPTPTPKVEAHPPGWILHYGKKKPGEILEATAKHISAVRIESLESKCLKVLSLYILEYLEAMGIEELHAALSMLPPETLSALSEAISKGKGMSDDLAYVVGKHAHVNELCFKSTTSIGDGNILTDKGIIELVPRLPTTSERGDDYEETWEDWEEAYKDESDDEEEFQKRQGLVVDPLHLEGVNVALSRLELVDCLYISADALLALLEKCACITHLSLAGSIQVVEDGRRLLLALPELLPALQVLDVTRCCWMSASVLKQMQCTYMEKYSFRKPPIVHCEGCFLTEQFQQGSIVSGPDW
jgi:hypothetical protein